MFCKVCKDAGKTETEYTSHYVKDKLGKTNCPTLLNQACKYCKQIGHTVKFCKTLRMNEKNKRRQEYFKTRDEFKGDTKKIGTSFADAFETDSEDELDQEKHGKFVNYMDDIDQRQEPLNMDVLKKLTGGDRINGRHLNVDIDLNKKVPVATNYIRSYVSVLVDDSVPKVENVKDIRIDTSHLKGKFWGDMDSDSDEE